MSSILFEQQDAVAIIRLNRPERLNAFNREMSLAMQARLDDCKDESIRAVMITGMGKAFSAGQDLAEVADPSGPGMEKILSEHYNPIIRRIQLLEKPVIAAVNGVAAGAGANMALGCDIVLAAESASFLQAFSKIGLVPDSGGTYFLPRLIGWQKASALMMLGEKVSATDAEKMGMVFRVYGDDIFSANARSITDFLASMPTKGLAYTKQLLRQSMNNSLDGQLDAEDEWQQKAASTNDYKEGVSAFLEKRKPVFTGK